MLHKLRQLHACAQGKHSSLLQGKGRVSSVSEFVPDGKQHQSSLCIEEQQSAATVIQEDANPGWVFCHTDIAHHTGVKKSVKQAVGKWKPEYSELLHGDLPEITCSLIPTY